MANVAEHRVNMPAYPVAGKAASAPEMGLNRFVRFVTLMERLGNALGTLAFTWATVVLLGGYPTVLRPAKDFWCAATIVFLEALRMFSRSNRMDYQLFFRTRGAFKSLSWNGHISLICFFNVFMGILLIWGTATIIVIVTLSVMGLLVIGSILCPEAAIPPMLRGMISLWSPMVAILLLCPIIWYSYKLKERHDSLAKCIVYLVLFVTVLLFTISRLRFPRIIKLADWVLGNKIAFWQRIVLNLCMFAATVMSVFNYNGVDIYALIIKDILVLVITSFGNLQIPAAVFRIGLALWRLIVIQTDYNDQKNHENTENLLSSLYIFYAMVLGQGIIYIVAGIFEIFSFILRRSLICHAGFGGPSGVKYVNLYYAYAFDRCMEGAVLGPKKTSLIIFAMDSLKSNSPKMQLYGLKMLHSFLKKEPLRTMAILELTTYTKTVTFLINMLDWTSEGAKDIRSFAAKIMAELAENLRVVPIPGAMQLIASLLDTVQGHNIKNPLLDTGSLETKHNNLIQQVGRNELPSPMLKWLKQMALYCLIPREEPTNMDEQNTHILRCWRKITKHWSVPEKEPSTDHDLLPVQGMLILERLATFDLENCIEISRATGLISKIVEFTSNRTDMKNIDETHETLLKRSSLRLLARLASTNGKFGVTLRQKITEHLFLWSNLAEILDNRGSSQELRELTAELVRNLAMDGNVNNEIRHIPMIISRLMHAFLSKDTSASADSDQLLRMNAGQALALLAKDSVNNCLVMLAEPGYVFIKELTIMIHSGRYRYIASSLLQSMCVHAQSELGNLDLKEISYITREVLEGIMDAEGTELEVLAGLSSQICNVIPDDFARELEHGQIKERFIKRLVNALNSNMIPTCHSPGIRRVIVEHVIYMMECNPGNANCFNKYWMLEALLVVERTTSRAENYRFFSGDAGLMEHSVPLSALVARAKELMVRG
ncbi:uncharacterized protein LOC123424996 [Hordeum vulgare subsp. vulgare]|uniref:BLE2 protein n=1 Tax=Hordeum vulgare subsp. vulgare TaxID=112509 RepID=A0A8I6X3B6_HORVV|nr:uncharacterized protein LOC123424996 [Hordeum vulgare subsp. vulgare]